MLMHNQKRFTFRKRILKGLFNWKAIKTRENSERGNKGVLIKRHVSSNALALLMLSFTGLSPDLGFTFVLSLRSNGNIKDSKTCGKR